MIASAGDAGAEEKDRFVPWFKERVALMGGGWFNFSDTDLGIRNNNTDMFQGFDLEDGLGLDEFTTVPWVRGSLRFFNRNRIIAEYSESKRNGTSILDEDLDLDGNGTVIPAGTGVRTTYQLAYVRAAYAFSIIKRDRLEIAISAGVHFLDFKLGVRALTSANEDLEDETSFSAPLPNVGMEGGWAINDRFAVTGGFSWLEVSSGGLSGGIWTGGGGIVANVLRHFAVGLRYQFLGLGADRTDNGIKTAIDDFSHGPVLFGALRF